MDENRIFKYIWRFNGIVLMIGGLLAIGMAIFTGYKIYPRYLPDHSVIHKDQSPVLVKDEPESTVNWRLGYLDGVTGTPYFMVALNAEPGPTHSYRYKSSDPISVRNYLFIDSRTNTRHWLLNSNHKDFASSDMLLYFNEKKAETTTLAILYKVTNEQTDIDRGSESDYSYVIALSRPDGTGYTEILQNVDMLAGARVLDEHRLLVVYQKNGVGYSAIVTLPEFELSNVSEFPLNGD